MPQWNDAGANLPDRENAIRNELNATGGSQTLSQILANGASAGGVKITNLADPASAQDAATKTYVDTHAGGGGSPQVFPTFNALKYGAVADGWTVTDANITATAKDLTTTSSTPFTSGMVGMAVSVQGAGTSNSHPLLSTISSFVSSSHVVLADAAGTTLANGVASGGTDNQPAFQSVMDAAIAAGGGEVVIPYSGTGIYYAVHNQNAGIDSGFHTIFYGASNVTIRGLGYPTILVPANQTNYRIVTFYGSNSNFRVTGLTFNGSWQNTVYGGGRVGNYNGGTTGEIDHYCIVIGGVAGSVVRNFSIDDNYFTGFGSKCIDIRPGSSEIAATLGRISNNVFYDTLGNQIEVYNAADIRIDGNFFTLCGGNQGVESIILPNAPYIHDVLVSGNIWYDTALFCESHAANLRVENNIMIQYGPTLQIGGANAIAWIHNTDLVSATSVRRFSVRNNYVDVSQASPPVYSVANSAECFLVKCADDMDISGNTLITDPMSSAGTASRSCVAIEVDPPGVGTTMTGLRIQGNRIVGGRITVGAGGGIGTNGVIRDVIISDNIIDGTLELTDQFGTIKDVLVEGNQIGLALNEVGDTTHSSFVKAVNAQVRNNIFRSGTSTPISSLGTTTLKGTTASGNAGYNPRGKQTAPAVPSTGTEQANTFFSDATVYVSGGTVTGIAVGLATPANIFLSTATTGGTLAGSTTYAYRVSARNSVGETLASTEVTIAVPAGTSTNTVTVEWPVVPGATSYRVYGRTSGAELLMATTTGLQTTWTDDGSVTPTGALPASNGTSTATGLTSGMVRVPAGMAIFPTYSVAPTWVWIVE